MVNYLSFRMLFIIGLFGPNICFGQVNLVPNPSFEEYDPCPFGISSMSYAESWINAPTGTSDYFNACASFGSSVSVPYNMTGYQEARTGNAYAGVIARYRLSCCHGYREYIQTELNEPLVQGENYKVKFYVNLADKNVYSIYDIGMYISDTLPGPTVVLFTPLPYTPQIQNESGNFIDTSHWKEVSGNYLANGGEKFITIGNFNPNYYPDTLFVAYNPDSLDQMSAYSYLLIDDVSITLDPLEPFIPPNVITPNGDHMNDFFLVNDHNGYSLNIYNRWGEIIFASDNYMNNFPEGEISDGVYYYVIKQSADLYKGFFHVFK